MPYLKKTVSAGGNIFIYKYFAVRFGKKYLRGKKCGRTPPKQKEINRRIQADKKRWLLLENFKKGDYWIDLNYRKGERPDDIETASKEIETVLKKLSRKLKTKNIKFTYMRLTERGEYGGLHHHLIIRNNFEIGELERLWTKGKVITDRIYSENLLRLADYFAKGRKATSEKKYSQSRNLVIPVPTTEVVSASRWRENIKPQKGYEIYEIFNGHHDLIGYEYQKIIMRRLE